MAQVLEETREAAEQARREQTDLPPELHDAELSIHRDEDRALLEVDGPQIDDWGRIVERPVSPMDVLRVVHRWGRRSCEGLC
jgi:hypothetical protein